MARVSALKSRAPTLFPVKRYPEGVFFRICQHDGKGDGYRDMAGKAATLDYKEVAVMTMGFNDEYGGYRGAAEIYAALGCSSQVHGQKYWGPTLSSLVEKGYLIRRHRWATKDGGHTTAYMRAMKNELDAKKGTRWNRSFWMHNHLEVGSLPWVLYAAIQASASANAYKSVHGWTEKLGDSHVYRAVKVLADLGLVIVQGNGNLHPTGGAVAYSDSFEPLFEVGDRAIQFKETAEFEEIEPLAPIEVLQYTPKEKKTGKKTTAKSAAKSAVAEEVVSVTDIAPEPDYVPSVVATYSVDTDTDEYVAVKEALVAAATDERSLKKFVASCGADPGALLAAVYDIHSVGTKPLHIRSMIGVVVSQFVLGHPAGPQYLFGDHDMSTIAPVTLLTDVSSPDFVYKFTVVSNRRSK